jgi:hypothetical protein
MRRLAPKGEAEGERGGARDGSRCACGLHDAEV